MYVVFSEIETLSIRSAYKLGQPSSGTVACRPIFTPVCELEFQIWYEEPLGHDKARPSETLMHEYFMSWGQKTQFSLQCKASLNDQENIYQGLESVCSYCTAWRLSIPNLKLQLSQLRWGWVTWNLGRLIFGKIICRSVTSPVSVLVLEILCEITLGHAEKVGDVMSRIIYFVFIFVS